MAEVDLESDGSERDIRPRTSTPRPFRRPNPERATERVPSTEEAHDIVDKRMRELGVDVPPNEREA